MGSALSPLDSGSLGLPVRKGFDAVNRHVRVRLPGEVNLKSCELLHPAAESVYADALRAIDPRAVTSYPLYERAIADANALLGVRSGRVLLTAGSDAAIALLVAAFGDHGRLVVHEPAYEGWHRYAYLNGATVNRVAPNADGEAAIDDLVRAVRATGPAIVVLTQPNGSTGRVFHAGEVESLATAVGQRGGILVLDTCYLAFTENGEDTIEAIGDLPHVVRVNSFSKTLGMAGARLAAIVATAQLEDYLARWQPEGPVSGVSLALFCSALQSLDVFEKVWSEVRCTRAYLAAAVPQLLPGWRARPSGANFVTFDTGTREQAAAACRFLLDRAIRIKDLSGLPGLQAAVRITVAERPVTDWLLDTLRQFADGEAGS